MNTLTCPRCHNRFYTALARPEAICPFCGFSFSTAELHRRAEKRFVIQRDCDIIRQGRSYSAKTVDVSKDGVGVELKGEMPFGVDDKLRVKVKGFDIDSDARVVWTKKEPGSATRAGLRLNGA